MERESNGGYSKELRERVEQARAGIPAEQVLTEAPKRESTRGALVGGILALVFLCWAAAVAVGSSVAIGILVYRFTMGVLGG